MNPAFDNFAELHELLDALCEERITEPQVRRLEELVLAHPEAEAHYVQFMSQYAELAQQCAGRSRAACAALLARLEAVGDTAMPAVNVEHVSPSRAHGSRRTRRLVWGAVALAVLATAIASFVLPRLSDPSRETGPGRELTQQRTLPPPGVAPDPEPVDDTIAVLLYASGAEWEPTGVPTQSGAPLSPGRLRLKAGYALVEFYSGATVILEGPADFELISPMEAFCARGKLRASVPPHAQGFTIGTPRLDLIDRGTEFGLQVEGNETEVHVFEGRVELYDAGTVREASSRRELTTGQALRVEGADFVSLIESDPAAFLTAEGLAARTDAEQRRRHRDWLSACEALRRDPKLVLHYTFQPDALWERALPNQAAGPAAAGDGAIVGCVWVDGRWPGKLALEFKRVSDRVRLNVPGEFDTLTYAAWVRVDALPNRFNSLLMTNSWDDAEPHWHISAGGVLELGVQGPQRQGGAHYYAPPVISAEQMGRWLHLAVVYDRPAGMVTQYVDGRIIDQQVLQLDVPLSIGDAEIGNWNILNRQHTSPIRHFDGRIDEFLVFARALGTAEIVELYEQGRPAE
jgi:hypothetical protein